MNAEIVQLWLRGDITSTRLLTTLTKYSKKDYSYVSEPVWKYLKKK